MIPCLPIISSLDQVARDLILRIMDSENYSSCVDCGLPKQYRWQTRTKRCKDCGRKKAAETNTRRGQFANCTMCGELKTGRQRRSSNCKKCGHLETAKKIKELGIQSQPEYRAKMSKSKGGSGVINQFSDASKLRIWANQVKNRDSRQCQSCGSSESLHAHHIRSKSRHPELAYEISNGVTVCERCHIDIHRSLAKID